jgi:hypothetical protein
MNGYKYKVLKYDDIATEANTNRINQESIIAPYSFVQEEKIKQV